MRWTYLLVGCLAGAGLLSFGTSCGGGNEPASAQAGPKRSKTLAGAVTPAEPVGQEPAPRSPSAPTARSNTARPTGPAPVTEARLPAPITEREAQSARESDALPPPADAEWTLFCHSITGPDHIERARALKADLLRRTPMKEWYLVHGDEQSTLYYGYYRSINNPKDPAESSRAKADRQKIETMKDAAGDRLFGNSLFVQLVAPDPDAPPEWDLERIVRKYNYKDNNRPFWSLQVGAYKDHPDRKKAAVEAVRAARALGEEAYFYHGETVSSVCIGLWPYDIVEGDAEAETIDPDQPLLVLPGNLPPTVNDIRDAQGKRVRAVTTRLKVVSPEVLAKMQQYPYHLVNGEETIYRGQTTTKQRTFLVVIPHPDDPDAGNQNGAAFAQTGGGTTGGARAGSAYQPRERDTFGLTDSSDGPPGYQAQAERGGGQQQAPPRRQSPPPRQQGTSGGGRLRSLDGSR